MSIYDFLTHEQENAREPLYMTLGVVTSIDDPDKLNRVKVRLINRSNSAYETDFIRTMTPMSGNEWGVYFIPEVGDEVIVGFCDGDISRPYVLGSLWSKKTPGPLKIKDKKNDVRMIKSRSGHTLVFDDEKDKTKVTLTTAVKKLTIKLEDPDELITISDKDNKNLVKINAKKNEITVLADAKITVDSKGNKLEIDGSKNNITISAKTKITLDAQDIDIKAKNSVKISGTSASVKASNTSIKGDAKVDVSASGPVNVKGAVVKLN